MRLLIFLSYDRSLEKLNRYVVSMKAVVQDNNRMLTLLTEALQDGKSIRLKRSLTMQDLEDLCSSYIL